MKDLPTKWNLLMGLDVLSAPRYRRDRGDVDKDKDGKGAKDTGKPYAVPQQYFIYQVRGARGSSASPHHHARRFLGRVLELLSDSRL